MIYDISLNDVLFDKKVNLDALYSFRKKTKDKEVLQLIDKKISIIRKRIERKIRKNYSVEINFSKGSVIESGLNSYDFDVVKESRLRNWINPVPTETKGYTKKNSIVQNFNRGRYHPKYPAIKWEYAPVVTSYIHYTKKRVIVYLENKVYRYRYSGKYFHFERVKHSFYLVHTKDRRAYSLTAYDIIYKLSKIRKDFKKLNCIILSN